MIMGELSKRYVRCNRLYRTRVENLKATQLKFGAEAAEIDATIDALTPPFWTKKLVQPVADALSKKTGRDAEVLGPFGIGCRVAIHLYPPGVHDIEKCLSITLCCGDLDEGELKVVDESVDTGRYAPGTVGEINGLNHPEHAVPASAKVGWFVKRLVG